jgi:hypothetical protein
MSVARIAEIVSKARNGHQPQPAEENGRDARGRFAPGNVGGPGNPYARQTARLRAALLEVVTEEDIKDVAAALLMKAKGGDLAAIKLLLAYVIGKPAEPTNPDRVDQEEWQMWKESPIQNRDLQRVLERGSPQLANNLVRAAVPSITNTMLQRIGATMRASLEPGDGAKPQVKDAPTTNGANGTARQAPTTNGANGAAARLRHKGPRR